MAVRERDQLEGGVIVGIKQEAWSPTLLVDYQFIEVGCEMEEMQYSGAVSGLSES